MQANINRSNKKIYLKPEAGKFADAIIIIFLLEKKGLKVVGTYPKRNKHRGSYIQAV